MDRAGKEGLPCSSSCAVLYDAHVTHRKQNQKISDDDYTKEMAQKRTEALAHLKAAATDTNFAEAKAKRDELKDAIAEVERRYTLYRKIPYEKDAHDVGDAEELAFRGWPP